jgi:hypothetical protein
VNSKTDGDEEDRLYQLPLAEFVTARNALAASLKSKGDKEGAARIKGLARPSVPAWAANQAYWQCRPEFEALVLATERLHRAQAGGEMGAPLREAMKSRREAQAALMARVEGMLESAGHGSTPSTVRRVFNTLEALAAPAFQKGDVRPGRLVQDLEAPGFEAVAEVAMAPRSAPASGPRRLTEAEEALGSVRTREVGSGEDSGGQGHDEARAALELAERRLETARREAREAAGAHAVAEKRAEGSQGELQEATRRFERAKERAAQAIEEQARTRLESERKAAAREVAETARDAALRAVRDLG